MLAGRTGIRDEAGVSATVPIAERDRRGLTPRELEVLRLLAAGTLTDREIADALSISPAPPCTTSPTSSPSSASRAGARPPPGPPATTFTNPRTPDNRGRNRRSNRRTSPMRVPPSVPTLGVERFGRN